MPSLLGAATLAGAQALEGADMVYFHAEHPVCNADVLMRAALLTSSPVTQPCISSHA